MNVLTGEDIVVFYQQGAICAMSISPTKIANSKKVTHFLPKPGVLHLRKPAVKWTSNTIQDQKKFCLLFTKTTGRFIECVKCKNIYTFSMIIRENSFTFERRCPFCETNAAVTHSVKI